MECHQCGACCVEISISSAIPGMPHGKPAGIPCVNLVDDKCSIFGQPNRPKICSSFPAMRDTCGTNKQEATILIREMERLTKPEV